MTTSHSQIYLVMKLGPGSAVTPKLRARTDDFSRSAADDDSVSVAPGEEGETRVKGRNRVVQDCDL